MKIRVPFFLVKNAAPKHPKMEIQWLCGKITGHEIGDWGWGGCRHVDTYCAYCNKYEAIPHEQFRFRKDYQDVIAEYGSPHMHKECPK